jgi:hypothetical protein
MIRLRRPGFRDPDNEHSIYEYIALITGFQIGIQRGARSVFEKSQELKGRSEKLVKCHTLNSTQIFRETVPLIKPPLSWWDLAPRRMPICLC